MANYVTITSDKSRRTAWWICLLFGLIGGHYFYVNRYMRGFLALITMNFFGLGWLADLHKIRVGKFKDNVGQYLRQ